MNSRSSRHCCRGRGWYCHGLSWKTVSTAGKSRSAATQWKSTSTGCDASWGAAQSARYAALVTSFQSDELDPLAAADCVDHPGGVDFAAGCGRHLSARAQRNLRLVRLSAAPDGVVVA